jgi:hypothetical protein
MILFTKKGQIILQSIASDDRDISNLLYSRDAPLSAHHLDQTPTYARCQHVTQANGQTDTEAQLCLIIAETVAKTGGCDLLSTSAGALRGVINETK